MDENRRGSGTASDKTQLSDASLRANVDRLEKRRLIRQRNVRQSS